MSEPAVHVEIEHDSRAFAAGDVINCSFRMQDVDTSALQAVETSVLWYTEGKGDEDIGVHFFRRRSRREMSEGDLQRVHRFSVTLPQTPYSYEGQIVKIRWCVRVRLFFKRARQLTFDQGFRLGNAHLVASDVAADPVEEERDADTL